MFYLLVRLVQFSWCMFIWCCACDADASRERVRSVRCSVLHLKSISLVCSPYMHYSTCVDMKIFACTVHRTNHYAYSKTNVIDRFRVEFESFAFSLYYLFTFRIDKISFMFVLNFISAVEWALAHARTTYQFAYHKKLSKIWKIPRSH